MYLSNRFFAWSKFTWYFGRRISSKFGILRKIRSPSNFLSAKLTVRGAMSSLTLSSFGHIGPSQISVLKIANVLLGVLPVLIDTSSYSPFFSMYEMFVMDIYMRAIKGCEKYRITRFGS